MTVLVQRYDEFHDDFVPRHPLPFVEKVGLGTMIHAALDEAAMSRQMVALLADMGNGKTRHGARAQAWYLTREEQRKATNHQYVPTVVVTLPNLRNCTYDQALELLIGLLDAREANRGTKAKRRSAAQLRERACALIMQSGVAALIVDDCEHMTPEAFDALRDVCAGCRDREMERAGNSAEGHALGVGVLFLGSPDADSLLRGSKEYGQRLTSIKTVPPLTTAHAAVMFRTWLPVTAALTGADADEWSRFLRYEICRDRETTPRYLEEVVREYARRLDRGRRLEGAEGWADVPLDYVVLRAVVRDKAPPDLSRSRRRRRARA